MTRRIPVTVGSIECGAVHLDADAVHYVRRVLRLTAGTPVELFDGAGVVGIGQLAETFVEVVEVVTHRPPTPFITLYQAIPKGDRWDWVVEKSTELGVDRIVPIHTHWSVVDTPQHKVAAKVERWQKIATAAARQCERVFTPVVAAPMGLSEALNSATGLNLLAHPGGQSMVRVADAKVDRVGLWVGPEAGFTPEEVALFPEGARVALAENILRAETAGVFGVGLLVHLTRGPT